MYDNSKETPEDKTELIIQLLKNYEKMNLENLNREFEKLDANKEEILKNRNYLEILVADTSLLFEGQERLHQGQDDLREGQGVIHLGQEVTNEEIILLHQRIDELIELQKKLITSQGIGDFVREPLQELSPSKEVLKQIEVRDTEIEKLKSQLSQTTNVEPEVNIDYLLQLANTQYYAKEFHNAIKNYDIILNEDSRNENALNNKGRALQALNQYEESIMVFDRLLEVNPRNLDALTIKPMILQSLGKYQESVIWFEKALEVNPTEIHSLLGIGDVHHMSGQYQEAIIWYDKTLQTYPDNQRALDSKQRSLEKLNQSQPTPPPVPVDRCSLRGPGVDLHDCNFYDTYFSSIVHGTKIF